MAAAGISISSLPSSSGNSCPDARSRPSTAAQKDRPKMNIQIFSDPRKPAYVNFDGASRPLKDPIRPETIAKVTAHQHGRGNMRLAVDKMEPLGVDLLRARGITIVEGQEITETARMIKSADELTLMDWTIKVTEAGMWRMREHSVPGKTENEIWAEL